MIRDKGKPMYDPDDQWIDREFVRTMMRVYRLSPETLGKMAEAQNLPSDGGAVRYIGPFRFTFYVTDADRNMFIDIHEPKLGVHLVHADWRNFMVVAQETAKELEEGKLADRPGSLDKLVQDMERLKKSMEIMKHNLKVATGAIADRLAGVASDAGRAAAVELRNLSRAL